MQTFFWLIWGFSLKTPTVFVKEIIRDFQDWQPFPCPLRKRNIAELEWGFSWSCNFWWILNRNVNTDIMYIKGSKSPYKMVQLQRHSPKLKMFVLYHVEKFLGLSFSVKQLYVIARLAATGLFLKVSKFTRSDAIPFLSVEVHKRTTIAKLLSCYFIYYCKSNNIYLTYPIFILELLIFSVHIKWASTSVPAYLI